MTENQVVKTDKANIIYIGTRSVKSLELMKTLTKTIDNCLVLVLDKEQMNRIDGEFVKNLAESKQTESVREFIKNPANLAKAFAQIEMARKYMGENEFSLKDVVDKSNMTYKTAVDLLDTLFSFGLVSYRTVENRKTYSITVTIEEKTRLIEMVEKEHQEALKTLKDMKKAIKKNVTDRNKILDMDANGNDLDNNK